MPRGRPTTILPNRNLTPKEYQERHNAKKDAIKAEEERQQTTSSEKKLPAAVQFS